MNARLRMVRHIKEIKDVSALFSNTNALNFYVNHSCHLLRRQPLYFIAAPLYQSLFGRTEKTVLWWRHRPVTDGGGHDP